MKNSLLFLFACLTGMAASSQNIVLKPGVGINVTNFSEDPETGKFTGQVGWQIGGSVAIGRKFYVEPGIFYVQQSSKYTDDTAPASDLTFDISGIRIPVTVGYNLIGNEKGAFNIRVLGGGSAFILTNANPGENSAYTSPTWGVFAGAGVDFLFLFVDLKYEWSLTNVSADTYNIGKTRTFFVNAGVKLPL